LCGSVPVPASGVFSWLCAGDFDGPADVDEVGVGEVPIPRLGDRLGGFEDLGVSVGVAEFFLGDLRQGVAALHGHPVRGTIRPSRGGQPEDGARGNEVWASAQDLSVEFGDLAVSASRTQLVAGDAPQRVPAPHPIANRFDLSSVSCGRHCVRVRYVMLGLGRAVVVAGRGHRLGGRAAGVLELLGCGGEQQQRGGDKTPSGELRRPQPRQRGCGDASQSRCGFDQD
jgi:hypothetical protein